tara:strand:+ start:42502 stop:43257 length:756 start_codon:yes stop_codon:yes gene_type:complete
LDQKRIRTYKIDAIILSQRQFGETDKLITVFTKEYGKKTIIAKGISKSTSPLVYHLDNMNLTKLVMSKGKNLDLVTQASVIESFENIRNTYELMIQGLYVLELVDKFSIDNSIDVELYDSIIATFTRINNNEPLLLNIRLFELNLLKSSGLMPEFNHCIDCSVSVSSEKTFVNVNIGGVLCLNCKDRYSDNILLSVPSIKVLRAMLFENYQQIKNIKISLEIYEELGSILAQFINYHLQEPTKSHRFLSLN